MGLEQWHKEIGQAKGGLLGARRAKRIPGITLGLAWAPIILGTWYEIGGVLCSGAIKSHSTSWPPPPENKANLLMASHCRHPQFLWRCQCVSFPGQPSCLCWWHYHERVSSISLTKIIPSKRNADTGSASKAAALLARTPRRCPGRSQWIGQNGAKETKNREPRLGELVSSLRISKHFVIY